MDWSPLWISLATSVTATAITLVVGLAAAVWRERHSGAALALVDGIFLLPLVLPPTVVGFFLLLLFGRHGPFGQLLLHFGATIVFSWPATVIAATVVSFPLMYITARAALEQVEPGLLEAARTLGATEWRVFREIALPLGVARCSGRHDTFVCAGAGRVRRHADDRRKYSRADRNNSDRHLFRGGGGRHPARVVLVRGGCDYLAGTS